MRNVLASLRLRGPLCFLHDPARDELAERDIGKTNAERLKDGDIALHARMIITIDDRATELDYVVPFDHARRCHQQVASLLLCLLNRFDDDVARTREGRV